MKILPRKGSPHVSVSLPRINEVTSQELLGIVAELKEIALPNIHKVRWSIAPRCLVPDHDCKEVLYVCINPTCREATRLAC